MKTERLFPNLGMNLWGRAIGSKLIVSAQRNIIERLPGVRALTSPHLREQSFPDLRASLAVNLQEFIASGSTSLLEMGCGRGERVGEVLKSTLKYVGIDEDLTLLGQAKAAFPLYPGCFKHQSPLGRGRITNLLGQKFTSGICFGVLSCYTPEAQIEILHSMRTLLDPGSPMFFTYEYGKNEFKDFGDGLLRHLVDLEYVRQISEVAGFSFDDFETSDEGGRHFLLLLCSIPKIVRPTVSRLTGQAQISIEYPTGLLEDILSGKLR